MEKKTVIGLVICITSFCSVFLFSDNAGMFFNVTGLVVVLSGTIGALLLSYKFQQLQIAFLVLRTAYSSRIKEPEEIVKILIDLAVKSHYQGLLSLEKDEQETTALFLRQALGLLVDGRSRQEISDILRTEMFFFKSRRQNVEQIFCTLSDIFPSFGLVGSVIGLISMLAGVGDTSVILATIPIALTSTLYGVVFANFFCTPFAAKVRELTNRQLIVQQVITAGVIAIYDQEDPRLLEKKLKSFLTPASRQKNLISLADIKKHLKILAEAEAEAEAQKNRPRVKAREGTVHGWSKSTDPVKP